MKACITRKGAVLLGKYVACDGFNKAVPLRVVTHAHADHMGGLRQSLRECEKALMTEATKDLIDVLRSPLFLMEGCVETCEYGDSIEYEGEQITFFRADHILGAAQVLVEDVEGTRLAFTGDFRIESTPVLDADVLVIEATYGTPSCQRSFRRNIENLLVSVVEAGLRKGPVYLFGYHGKLQEVMQIMYKAGVKVPFVMPERVLHVSKICEKHGMHFGHRLMLCSEMEAQELLKKNSACLVFCHMSSRSRFGSEGFRVYLSGWQFNSPWRHIGNNEYLVALSDHSDFDGLVEYVRRSKPKLVITDNFRAGHAKTLAKEIRKRFKIPASALPRR